MVAIRSLAASDREDWDRLWAGYLRFYRARMADDVRDLTWRRLLAGDGLHALVAEEGGRLVGLAHYLFHPSTWTVGNYCYLQDLFVAEHERGGGAGRALIQAVYERADEAGASRVYWMTQEFNAEARALYDTLAHRTSFIQYRR